MKVAMIETGGWGGIGHYAHCLCSAISDAGVKVVLLTHANRYQLDKLPKNYAQRNIFKGDGFVSDWLRLHAALKAENPDVAHFQSLLSTRRDWCFFLLYRYFMACPQLVYTAHNVLPHELVRGERIAYRLLYRNAAGLIVHSSESLKKISLLLNGKIPAAVSIIPHGHYGLFSSRPDRSCRESLALLNLEAAEYLLFFGAIRPYKGLDRLLQAVAKIKQWPSDLKLLVVGQPMHGVTANDVNKIVRQHNLEGRVVLKLGYVPEEHISAVYSIAGLVVLPYLDIDQSGVLMAAMAAGKAVLCTPVGAFTEVVSPEFGFLAAGCTVDQLSDALRRAIDKRGRWLQMGAMAKKTAEDRYAWDDIAGLTLAFYRRLMLRSGGAMRNGGEH